MTVPEWQEQAAVLPRRNLLGTAALPEMPAYSRRKRILIIMGLALASWAVVAVMVLLAAEVLAL